MTSIDVKRNCLGEVFIHNAAGLVEILPPEIANNIGCFRDVEDESGCYIIGHYPQFGQIFFEVYTNEEATR